MTYILDDYKDRRDNWHEYIVYNEEIHPRKRANRDNVPVGTFSTGDPFEEFFAQREVRTNRVYLPRSSIPTAFRNRACNTRRFQFRRIVVQSRLE